MNSKSSRINSNRNSNTNQWIFNKIKHITSKRKSKFRMIKRP